MCGGELIARNGSADSCELPCAVAQQTEVYRDIEEGLGTDGGGDEVRAEAGVRAEGMEEKCLFCGGPVACRRVVGWCVGRLWWLWCAGEVVECGGDVGVEVGSEVDGGTFGFYLGRGGTTPFVGFGDSVCYHLEFSFER